MVQKHTFEISRVIDGSKPTEEFIILNAKDNINTTGFALVDRTFDEDSTVSNEFRHIFIFPDLELKKGEIVVVCTGEGKNGIRQMPNGGTKFYALYWGAKECIWNDKGGDTATLINFVTVNSQLVPPVEKKKA